MGVVTVTIDDEVEERFREKLADMGNKKGAMGEAVSEALDEWIRHKDEERPRWMNIAEEGIDLGGDEFDRDKANER